MKIMDILVKEAVILDLASSEKRAVLEELSQALAAAEGGLDAERLLHVLQEREALQSTGIGEGVAIPHGKLAGLPRLVASFARSREGVDEAHEFVKKLGAKIIHGPEEAVWAPGYYSVLFEDPDGIRLEINFVPGKGLLE